MSHRLAPYVKPFGLNDALFERALSLVPQDRAGTRLDPATNTFQGLAAHLVMARHGLAEALGLSPAPLPFHGLGEGFEAGFVEVDVFPTLETLAGSWRELGATLASGLPEVGDETLAQPSPFPIPGLEESTLGDFAALNVVHESYHVGQMGLIAKSVSGEGVIPPPESSAA